MATWRPVDVRVWSDRKFLAGGDDARLLWLFLLTCPSLPIPGVVIGGDAALAELIGWTSERLRERFAEIQQNGLRVVRETRIVWLPNSLHYQRPMNPNMVKGWGKKWDDVPEGELKLELWEALRIACKSWSILFAKLFPKPSLNGYSNSLVNGSSNSIGNHAAHYHYHQHQHDQEEKREGTQAPLALVNPTPAIAKRPKASRTAMPDLWSPDRTPANLSAEQIAKARGVDLREQLLAMRDWAASIAERKADWNATWRNWIRRSKPAMLTTSNGARVGRIEPKHHTEYPDGDQPL